MTSTATISIETPDHRFFFFLIRFILSLLFSLKIKKEEPLRFLPKNTTIPLGAGNQPGNASLSPSIPSYSCLGGILGSGGVGSCFEAPTLPTGTKPQLSSNIFIRLSMEIPSRLVYGSSSNEPVTQIRLPFWHGLSSACWHPHPMRKPENIVYAGSDGCRYSRQCQSVHTSCFFTGLQFKIGSYPTDNIYLCHSSPFCLTAEISI